MFLGSLSRDPRFCYTPFLMKSIVVTGAAGMIGSGVVRALNDRGQTNLVLVDDLKRTEKWRNLVGKQFSHLLSKRELFEWLRGREGEIEGIIHLGACSDTVETDADYLLENNTRYTTRLSEWALSHNLRFVYASSAATYGDGSRGFDDDESGLKELKPLNMYGYSKHLADLWLQEQGALKRAVGLKYFNIFGPNEYHKGRMASMILKMHDRGRQEGVIHLFKSNDPTYPDGGQLRDFLYVKDAVAMTLQAYDRTHVGGIFNIGRGATVTWNQLAIALFDALGVPPKIVYIDMPPELHRQYQNYTCAQMAKFPKLVGPFQSTGIPQAVRDYVHNYLQRDARW